VLGLSRAKHFSLLYLYLYYRTPLDCCQEAIELLEAAIADNQCYGAVPLQDTLATAYLWKGILQHEDIMRLHGHELEIDEDTSESLDQVGFSSLLVY